MNTNRTKSNATKLHVPRKNQKSPQEEFGAEVHHGSTERKQKSKVNEQDSERTAWN